MKTRVRQGKKILFPDGRSVQIEEATGQVTVIIETNGDHVRIVPAEENVQNELEEKPG